MLEVFVVVVCMNTNVRSRRVEEEILNSVRSITSVRYSKMRTAAHAGLSSKKAA